MSKYQISWVDEVHRSIELDASTKEEALKKWKNGDYDTSKLCEDDSITTSEDHEIEIEVIDE